MTDSNMFCKFSIFRFYNSLDSLKIKRLVLKFSYIVPNQGGNPFHFRRFYIWSLYSENLITILKIEIDPAIRVVLNQNLPQTLRFVRAPKISFKYLNRCSYSWEQITGYKHSPILPHPIFSFVQEPASYLQSLQGLRWLVCP